jgi:GR25 family glycosyltransferase involved in LPS biosynthesis
MEFCDYFDRIAIIHLPERKDRFDSLSRELRGLDIDIAGPKIRIPPAPRSQDAHGFPSNGVYGNFLSHLSILRQALDDGLRNIWVLEDDAIFSRRMCRNQTALIESLSSREWDLCYFGHSLSGRHLAGKAVGLVPTTEGFMWAHCYAVHARVLPRLVSHLEQALVRPEGHPLGGKLYIDAAFTLFRRFNSDVTTLVANPVLSVQKGCMSNLGGSSWYDRMTVVRPLFVAARALRDHLWKLRA